MTDDCGDVAAQAIAATNLMAMHIEELGLTVRASNCLAGAEIIRVDDLVRKTSTDLLTIPNMGVTSVYGIERVLREWGLRLGMQDAEKFGTFINAIEFVRQHGIDRVAEFVHRAPDELLEMPGMDRTTLEIMENGLERWKLYIERMRSGRAAEHPVRQQEKTDRASAAPVSDVHCPGAELFKDELLHAVTRLLSKARTMRQFHCFVAYHGIDGAPRRTLEEIGGEGTRYGFDRAVTRERIRQLRSHAEQKLRRDARRIRFARWEPAVEASRRNLPAAVHSFVSWFGYVSPPDPMHVYSMLELCADMFKLDFPFELRTLSGLEPVVVDCATRGEFEALTRLREVAGGPYAELADAARQLGCGEGLLQRVIETSPQWEFLDHAGRYFWKRPRLPPQNYGKTGNPILTSLCKIFSAVKRAFTSDLALSVIRDRMLRKNGLLTKVPIPVLEGIAERSGLFEIRDGEIARKPELEWCTIGQRDLALLSVCVEYGRVVPSNVIYSRLVQYGLGQENAAVTVAYSPFLVHTQSGVGHKEGIYKFVPRPEEIDLDVLEVRVRAGSNACDVTDEDEESDVWVRIPISSRIRLSGRHFDPETIGLTGTWEVRDGIGTEVGCVTISEGTVSGLKPVIDALGLEKDDVLVLRRVDRERSLVAVV